MERRGRESKPAIPMRDTDYKFAGPATCPTAPQPPVENGGKDEKVKKTKQLVERATFDHVLDNLLRKTPYQLFRESWNKK